MSQNSKSLKVRIIVADILRLLESFQEANTSFVRRSDNGVTHSVAQKAARDPTSVQRGSLGHRCGCCLPFMGMAAGCNLLDSMIFNKSGWSKYTIINYSIESDVDN